MEQNKRAFLFNKSNYIYLIVGVALNILGFILMIGGGSKDPNVFKAEELFSTTRITIAPILILLGYAIIIYSIMKKPKIVNNNTTEIEKTVN